MREQRQVEITKIRAKQAVLVAVITAVSSIVVTIFATKSMERPFDSASATSEAPNDVSGAPFIFVASADPGRPGATVAHCKSKANAEINARRGRVVAIGKSWIALEWQGFGIMVMCEAEGHGASVIVAGKDSRANGDLAMSLRAAVLERQD